MKTKLVISLIPWAAQVLYVSYTGWFLWYYETWPGLVTEAVYIFFIAATLYLFALNRSNSVRLGVKIAINKMFAISFVPLHLAAMVSATSPYLPLAFDLPPSRESKANAAAALSNMYHLRTHTNAMPLLKGADDQKADQSTRDVSENDSVPRRLPGHDEKNFHGKTHEQ